MGGGKAPRYRVTSLFYERNFLLPIPTDKAEQNLPLANLAAFSYLYIE